MYDEILKYLERIKFIYANQELVDWYTYLETLGLEQKIKKEYYDSKDQESS